MIPTDDPIGKPRAEERHEIDGEDERVDDARRRINALPQSPFGNLASDVAGQNAFHAVKAESLAGLVPDDVFDLGGPTVCGRVLIRTHVTRLEQYEWLGGKSAWPFSGSDGLGLGRFPLPS